MAGPCLSYATIDMAPTIRIRESHRGLFGRERGAGTQGPHNMHWNISASRLSAYRRILSFGSIVRRAMFRVYKHIAGRPQLNAFMKRSIARLPFLDRRLRAIIRTERESRFQPVPTPTAHVDVADLTPRAHQVYLDLVRALKSVQ
jgi:hypothetical protein